MKTKPEGHLVGLDELQNIESISPDCGLTTYFNEIEQHIQAEEKQAQNEEKEYNKIRKIYLKKRSKTSQENEQSFLKETKKTNTPKRTGPVSKLETGRNEKAERSFKRRQINRYRQSLKELLSELSDPKKPTEEQIFDDPEQSTLFFEDLFNPKPKWRSDRTIKDLIDNRTLLIKQIQSSLQSDPERQRRAEALKSLMQQRDKTAKDTILKDFIRNKKNNSL